MTMISYDCVDEFLILFDKVVFYISAKLSVILIGQANLLKWCYCKIVLFIGTSNDSLLDRRTYVQVLYDSPVITGNCIKQQ